MDSSKGKKTFAHGLRVFLWAILAVLVLLFLAYGILTPVAAARQERAQKRWAEAGQPITGLAETYPAQVDSPSALGLDACCARIGISLRSNDPKTNAVPPESASAWGAVREELVTYLSELEKPEAATPPPPEKVSTFLARQAPALQEIRDRLGEGDIRWRMEIEKGFAAEIPSLIGHLDLTRILLAEALAEHAAGRDGNAIEDVRAVWDLSSVIEPRPELISQLVCIAIRRLAAGTLRRLEGVPPDWNGRLASWEPEKGLLRSYAAEAAAMGTVWEAPSVRAVAGNSPGGVGDRIVTFLARPYIRLCLADAQSLLLDQVSEARKLGPCASDAQYLAVGSKAADSIPRWNLFAAIALPNQIGGPWGRAKHARIQLELTEKVLALKAARAAGSGWPASFPDIEKSFCPKERWNYAVTPDGAMSLTFSGAAASREIVRTPFPQEYREGPGKEGGGSR